MNSRAKKVISLKLFPSYSSREVRRRAATCSSNPSSKSRWFSALSSRLIGIVNRDIYHFGNTNGLFLSLLNFLVKVASPRKRTRSHPFLPLSHFLRLSLGARCQINHRRRKDFNTKKPRFRINACQTISWKCQPMIFRTRKPGERTRRGIRLIRQSDHRRLQTATRGIVSKFSVVFHERDETHSAITGPFKVGQG